ncbi:MAG: hypothetical protein NTW30_01200 [Candidatus Aenigmarchaeota archaeon]|nr:hypothetical protein [Candidatus Aenigmarchaeota archaeon]
MKIMKDGDFIQIDYVGKIVESGEIFDLTKEDLAKEKGLSVIRKLLQSNLKMRSVKEMLIL